MVGRRHIRRLGPEDGLHSFVCKPQSMRLAVLLVCVACAGATSAKSRDESNETQDKPGYAPTEAPDKQVEYVTGPNVGIVGPTVLGGKGQEAQPSGEELQSTDKEQRDVSSQYSGYERIAAQQESKEQENEDFPKYSYGEGVKYIQRQEHDEQTEKESHEKKNQVIKIGNNHGSPKVAYYQRGGSYPQPTPSEPNYYRYIPVPQNQELSSAQLLARIRTHQLSQLLNRGPSEYQQVAAQNHGQEERGISQSQAQKFDASSSLSSQDPHSSGDYDGRREPQTNASPVYIPQEYLQYQIAAAQEDLQSTLQSPGKQVFQLFLPQDGTSGHINIEAQQPQVAPLQKNPNLRAIHNGHQIQYVPTYYPSQSPLPGLKTHHSASQNPAAQIIQPNQEVSHPATNIQNAQSSSPIIPPTYQQPQPHPQIYSNFQPSQHQPLSPFSNEPTQYQLLQQSNEPVKRPQEVYHQTKQTTQPTQNQIATKPSNNYIQSHSQPTIYRPKTPERLPQRQPESLALVSQSPPKTTQHRQTHDKPQHLPPQERPHALQSHDRPQVLQTHERPQAAKSHDRPQSFQPHERPQALQSDQVYHTESIQPTVYKLSATHQNNPYTNQKFQPPIQIQSSTPFPVKVVPIQSQAQPLTYQLPRDKEAFRSIIYPVATQFGQALHTETPQPLGLIPTEAAMPYNVKIPSYIKALEEAGHLKPFGFSQMSYGQRPGSYSYSIFNKHS